MRRIMPCRVLLCAVQVCVPQLRRHMQKVKKDPKVVAVGYEDGQGPTAHSL